MIDGKDIVKRQQRFLGLSQAYMRKLCDTHALGYVLKRRLVKGPEGFYLRRKVKCCDTSSAARLPSSFRRPRKSRGEVKPSRKGCCGSLGPRNFASRGNSHTNFESR